MISFEGKLHRDKQRLQQAMKGQISTLPWKKRISLFSESRIYVFMYQQVIKIYIYTSVTSNTTLVSECSLHAKPDSQ